jgi:hypothetical protein
MARGAALEFGLTTPASLDSSSGSSSSRTSTVTTSEKKGKSKKNSQVLSPKPYWARQGLLLD